MLGETEINKRFDYHAPDDAKRANHELVRSYAKDLAGDLDALVPDGREKSLALTALEECLMWANAGIARN